MCLLSDGWIAGLFFDGRRSKGYPARLRRQDQHLLIEYAEGETLEARLSEVRLGTRVGQAGCYLHLQDGAAFESFQTEALGGLLQGAAGRGGANWLRRLESNVRLIVISALLVLMTVGVGVVHGVPWISRHIADALPQGLERVMGENALATLENSWLEPTALDEAHQQRLRQAFAPHLARLAERHGGPGLKVHFYASPALGANALALPGGIIIFTDELVQLAENDDELVAVLAHEAGHAVHRHGLRNVVQGSLVLWMIMGMTGDLAAASDLLVTIPALLVSLDYSRAMEREADDFALQYLPAEGVQPAHFAHILLRLQERGRAEDSDKTALRVPDLLSSHPDAAERVQPFLAREGAANLP